jgi:catechol 2,3-dioxygenase-like lactoylglutathione lyase family enzyme
VPETYRELSEKEFALRLGMCYTSLVRAVLLTVRDAGQLIRAGGFAVVIVGELMEVILYVQDVGAQVAFYRDLLGLKVKEPRGEGEWAGVHWAELDTGSCTLALHTGGQHRLGEDAPKIVFRVSDVPGARHELMRRGIPMGEVRSPAPGVQVSDGADPEGNKFSIESRSGVGS